MKKWHQKLSYAMSFGSTESLPQIAHIHCRKPRCIVFGVLENQQQSDMKTIV
jgi:hypothetical protein